MANHHVHLKEWTAFSMSDRYFLVRVKTQFSQEISKQDFDALQALPNRGPVTVDDDQLDLMNRCKLLDPKPKTEEEETAYEHRIAENALKAIRPFSALELLVAQACNMRCKYCLAGDGEYGRREMMNWDVAKKALDRMIGTARETADKSGKNPHASILFFGGEPLMNLPLIKQCVTYCDRELGEGNTSYSLTTNGVLLTPETMDWLDANRVSYALSFDGPYQNENRPIRSGEDSYQMIVGRIWQVINKHGSCAVIGTVFPEQKREEIVREIKNLFGDKVRYQINAVGGSGVTGARDAGPCAEMGQNSKRYPEWTMQFIEAINGRDGQAVKSVLADNYFRKFAVPAIDSPGAPLVPVFCGCGRGMCSVDCEGNLYPCQSFVGVERYCQGNLDSGYDRGVFSRHITQENAKCRHCAVRYACPGDCMMNTSTMPEAANLPEPVFYAPDEFCELQHTKQRLRALIHWSIDGDARAWFHRTFDKSEEK